MNVFGQAVVYTPAAGTPFQVSGIFDEEYLDLMGLDRGQLAQLGFPGNTTEARPVLGVQLSQFATPPMQGDTFTLMLTVDVFPAASGASYKVMEVRPDSHGWAKLLLNDAP